jgi:hypothetical protein
MEHVRRVEVRAAGERVLCVPAATTDTAMAQAERMIATLSPRAGREVVVLVHETAVACWTATDDCWHRSPLAAAAG